MRMEGTSAKSVAHLVPIGENKQRVVAPSVWVDTDAAISDTKGTLMRTVKQQTLQIICNAVRK